jgi:hypothetical protein
LAWLRQELCTTIDHEDAPTFAHGRSTVRVHAMSERLCLVQSSLGTPTVGSCESAAAAAASALHLRPNHFTTFNQQLVMVIEFQISDSLFFFFLLRFSQIVSEQKKIFFDFFLPRSASLFFVIVGLGMLACRPAEQIFFYFRHSFLPALFSVSFLS